jgi:N-acetylated-alpha-linked acidic dipeptidase
LNDTQMLERFLDPGYLGHAAAARVTGLAALRLANAAIVPLRYSTYAEEVAEYVGRLQELQRDTPGAAQTDLAPLLSAAEAWGAATAELERAAEGLVRSDDVETRRVQRQIRRVDRAPRRQERLLTTAEGLPGRPWFRHQIYAPGLTTGYAVQTLPGLRYAVEAGDTATVERYLGLLLASLGVATAEARAALPESRT